MIMQSFYTAISNLRKVGSQMNVVFKMEVIADIYSTVIYLTKQCEISEIYAYQSIIILSIISSTSKHV